MGYLLYIFDLDGTLINSRHSITSAFKDMCRDMGIPGRFSADTEAYIGFPLTEIFKKLGIKDVDRARELYRHYYYQYIHTEKPFPGIESLLKKMKGRYMMAVATNKAYKGCIASLDRTGLLKYFDVMEAVDTGIPKPDRNPFDRILKFYQAEGRVVSPEECLMVGDSPVDMAFSRNAGIDSAFVTWGFYSEDALAFKPTYRVSSPEALLSLHRT